MKRLIAALLIAASSPSEAWDWPGTDETERELAKLEAFMARADEWIWLNASPLRRAVACRIGGGTLSVDALTRATGAGKARLLAVLEELMNRRLIRPGGPGLIEPYDADAAARLRRWAARWCGAWAGDECGVAR